MRGNALVSGKDSVMRSILEMICSELNAGRAVASAVIISASGSTPRRTGSRMAISADDRICGSVGGGTGEATVRREVQTVFHRRRGRLLRINLTDRDAAADGMICGGDLEVLIEHIPATAGNLRLFARLLEDWDAGNGRVLFTVYREDPPEAHALCRTLEPSRLPEVLSEALREEMRNRAGKTRLPFVERENECIVLAEPMRPPGRVFIAGAGHVGRATAVLAGFVGFDTIVLDDRPDFLCPQLFPGNCRLKTLAGFADCFDGFDLRADSLIVIVTRGHMHDKTVLAQALCTRAGYIGMIGSRRKRDAIYARLRDEGFSWSVLERVRCPIGVDIGGDTPEEIAVSIVAELIQKRAGED